MLGVLCKKNYVCFTTVAMGIFLVRFPLRQFLLVRKVVRKSERFIEELIILDCFLV